MTTLLVALLLSQSQTMPRTVICDKGFDCATVTGGKLDVNSTVTMGDVSVAVFADPSGNTTVHRLDADGKVQIAGTINASSSATATAAAPSYGEGTSQAFSQTLAGRLRTITQVDPAVVSTVSVANFPATQPVSGTVTASVDPARATTVVVSGTVPVSGTFWQSTQPVSGTVTASVDPARATTVVQGTSPWVVSGTVTASGPLTDTQLRATPVPVSGTFWQTTQPVSGTVTVTDGAGALNVIVDSGAVAATQSGTWNVGTVTTLTGITNTVTVAGGTADNAAAGSTNVHTLPAVVETSTTMPTRTDGNRAALIVDGDGKLFVRTHDADPLSSSSGLSTATTLTELVAAPGASVSIYITGITFSASVAATTTTDQQMTLKYGTGTNCGTGTTYLWGAFNPANGGAVVQLAQPIRVAANNALCWIHAAAGSKIVQVSYFIAP